MISRNPKDIFKEKVHTVDTETEEAEEKDLIIPLEIFENGPFIACPHIWFELVN